MMVSVCIYVIVIDFPYFRPLVPYSTIPISMSNIRSCCFRHLHRLAVGLSIFCVLSYCVFFFFCFVFVMLLSHNLNNNVSNDCDSPSIE